MELQVFDRNYTNWQFTNLKADDILAPYIHPLASKLYHGDIVSSSGTLLHSPYQTKTAIPGVLVLEGKTYGRVNGKLLYKCIPNDPALPCFLIPYEEKVSAFIKKKCNKYITFKIKDWPDKHPVGQLTNTLGDVTQPEHYYQYQLACKNLQQPIAAFNKETMAKLNSLPREKITEDIIKKLTKVDDRRTELVFSIDPPGCKDIDDAIGLRVINKRNSIISIYIANVALVLDYLDLWAVCSERVATIYLPNGRIPMLPPVLADDICSLIQGEDRWAFCLDIHINELNEPTVTQLVFKPVLLNVHKNYAYEEAGLLRNKTYGHLLTLTKSLNKHYNYVDQLTDSHDLVEFYMIFMNYESSKQLLLQQSGIFRTAQLNAGPVTVPATLSKEMRTFIKSFMITQCEYCTSAEVRPHELIGKGLASYVHITSPIRRLVDLLNQIDLQRAYMSNQANAFSVAWGKRIDYINTTMKAIRKVQNNCMLLYTYLQQPNEAQHYTGLVFGKTQKKDLGKEIYKYSIYIPALKMVSSVKTENNYDNYRTVVVSTHAFSTEDNILKKIRLQISNL